MTNQSFERFGKTVIRYPFDTRPIGCYTRRNVLRESSRENVTLLSPLFPRPSCEIPGVTWRRKREGTVSRGEMEQSEELEVISLCSAQVASVNRLTGLDGKRCVD